jgi:hypothetical protein
MDLKKSICTIEETLRESDDTYNSRISIIIKSRNDTLNKHNLFAMIANYISPDQHSGFETMHLRIENKIYSRDWKQKILRRLI